MSPSPGANKTRSALHGVGVFVILLDSWLCWLGLSAERVVWLLIPLRAGAAYFLLWNLLKFIETLRWEPMMKEAGVPFPGSRPAAASSARDLAPLKATPGERSFPTGPKAAFPNDEKSKHDRRESGGGSPGHSQKRFKKGKGGRPHRLPTPKVLEPAAQRRDRRDEVIDTNPEPEDPAASLIRTQELWKEMDVAASTRLSISTGNQDPYPSSESKPKGLPETRILASTISKVWNDYLAEGDGHFNIKGLTEALSSAGVEAMVLPPDELVGLGNPVLGIVDTNSPQQVFLVPDFTRPPRTVERWFKLEAGLAHSARIGRLVSPAQIELRGESYEVISWGRLE